MPEGIRGEDEMANEVEVFDDRIGKAFERVRAATRAIGSRSPFPSRTHLTALNQPGRGLAYPYSTRSSRQNI